MKQPREQPTTSIFRIRPNREVLRACTDKNIGHAPQVTLADEPTGSLGPDSPFEFVSDHAVQKLTYRWLEEDLNRINWLG